ncbi:hypothetical protein LVB87_05145 [Lysobacter sp. KIS68-7]|uniref:hypothetical protein n=1 Tax=Lysobacter sp. KIS68-7 TaxID=2904252 RepID=UPI001E312AE7|nr:hypothetical protein [Lysobacter sp. KIS68-7]UHQ20543.1 hypothetical protein LVB87_05145 [Lysobacter sp. KIS68-7]
MSIHTQLTRGLVALPVAALLLAAGALSPVRSLPCPVPGAETAEAAEATVALPRTVEFHSMIPGALHIVKHVKVGTGT